jgi:hypothetical protein
VPSAAEVDAVVGLFDDWNHLRVVGQGLDERVRIELAEAPRKGDLVAGGDVLIPKEQHQVLEPGAMHLFENCVVHAREVDTRHFGPERAHHGHDADVLERCGGHPGLCEREQQ